MTPQTSLSLSLTLKGVLFIGLCLAATPLAEAATQTSFSSAEQCEDKAIPAVVQVYREIGLSVTGSWSHYKAKPLESAMWKDKEMGWTPGLQMDASTMFRIQNIRHLLVALHFSFGDGNVEDHAHFYSPWFPGGSASYTAQSKRLTTDTRIEFGKGFLVTDRFMVTPAIQGGYHTWTREKFDAYHQFMVGVMLHLDYAVTNDLVLRGRLGWAELLGSEMQPPYATFHQADRPLWEGGLDLDYRLTRRIHLIGGALYTHSSLGRSRFSSRDGGRNSMYIASSWTNGLTLHLGAAYAF